ncbi:hypothetical protein GLT90_02170 [Nanohaloarchaea archaeon H12]|nr:hypothetical protein [Nanohaloarchaea archaeon H12]
MELKPGNKVKQHLEQKTANREIQTARLRTLLSHVDNYDELPSDEWRTHIYEIALSRYLEDLMRHLTGQYCEVEVEVRDE